MGNSREHCGVFGVYAPGEDVAAIACLGLLNLQHRGQQGAGIAVADSEGISVAKGLGLISEAFDRGSRLHEVLPEVGRLAIGHTLYGTTNTGDALDLNRLAPVRYRTQEPETQFALGSNGHIEKLGPAAVQYDIELHNMPSDTHVIVEALGRELEETGDMVTALKNVMPLFQGAYSMTIATADSLYAVRDPLGFRPLHLGKIKSDGYVVASEIPALSIVGGTPIREINPGEIVRIDDTGVNSYSMSSLKTALCGFEFVYFSRPDNKMEGELVAEVRRRIGEILARGDTTELDVVFGVPKSGLIAAEGYAYARGLPNMPALVKNDYVNRTFITPGQTSREEAVRQKLNVIRDYVADKRVCVVDDSIVRGTTTKVLVKMLREAGAKEVHLRVASPPYIWPCYFGMNTRDRSKLIAGQVSQDEVRKLIGADSLHYLTNDQLTEALGMAANKVCNACTTGNYPIQIY